MTSFAYSIPSNTDIEKREYTTIANRIYPDLNIFQKVLGLLNSRVGYLWSDRLGLRSANLVSRIHQDYKTYPNSRVNLTYSYQYKLDAKGRPIEVKEITSPRSSTTYVITSREVSTAPLRICTTTPRKVTASREGKSLAGCRMYGVRLSLRGGEHRQR